MAVRQPGAQYPTNTKTGKKGQFTVPKEVREQRFGQLCERISATLAGAGLTPDAVLATLLEARQRVFARRYQQGADKKISRRRTRSNRSK